MFVVGVKRVRTRRCIFGEPAGAETFDLILASLLRGSVVTT